MAQIFGKHINGTKEEPYYLNLEFLANFVL